MEKKPKKSDISKTRKISVYVIFGAVLALIIVGIVMAILRSIGMSQAH